MCLGKNVSLLEWFIIAIITVIFYAIIFEDGKNQIAICSHGRKKMCLLINGKYSHIVFTKCLYIPVWNCWNAEKWKYERITFTADYF